MAKRGLFQLGNMGLLGASLLANENVGEAFLSAHGLMEQQRLTDQESERYENEQARFGRQEAHQEKEWAYQEQQRAQQEAAEQKRQTFMGGLTAQLMKQTGFDARGLAQIMLGSGVPEFENIGIAELLESPEGYTLGEGEVRYGPGGEVVARGPAKTYAPQQPSEIDRKIATFRQITGRNPTTDEMRQMYGMVPDQAAGGTGFTLPPGSARYNDQGQVIAERPSEPKQTLADIQAESRARAAGTAEGTPDKISDRDQMIADAMRLHPGLSEADATDVVDKIAVVITDPVSGASMLYNTATKETKEIPIPTPEIPPAPQPSGQPGLAEDVESASGIVSGIESLTEGTFGQVLNIFSDKRLFPADMNARNRVELFERTAQQSLSNNPKFPEGERKLISGMIPSTSMWTNPPIALDKLINLRDYLVERRSANEKTLRGGLVTAKEMGNLRNQIASIDRVLEMMGNVPKRGVQGPAPSGDIEWRFDANGELERVQ